MLEAKAYAACLTRVEKEDYLELRTRRLLARAVRSGIACLELGPPPSSAVASLVPLVRSCHLVASDFEALAPASRGHCRALGSVEAMVPLLQLILAGFEEVRYLASAGEAYFTQLDAVVHQAKTKLYGITKDEVRAIRLDARSSLPGRVEENRIVLEVVTVLLSPGEPAHDCIAARVLLTEGNIAEKAALLKVDDVPEAKSRRFRRMVAQHRDTIAAVKQRGGAPGAFAEWVEAVHAFWEEQSCVCELFRMKNAVTEHVAPLARWATRPHLRPLLGRMGPPPDPPERVLAGLGPSGERPERPASAPRSEAPAPEEAVAPQRPHQAEPVVAPLRVEAPRPAKAPEVARPALPSEPRDTARPVRRTPAAAPSLAVPRLSPRPPETPREPSQTARVPAQRQERAALQEPPVAVRIVKASGAPSIAELPPTAASRSAELSMQELCSPRRRRPQPKLPQLPEHSDEAEAAPAWVAPSAPGVGAAELGRAAGAGAAAVMALSVDKKRRSSLSSCSTNASSDAPGHDSAAASSSCDAASNAPLEFSSDESDCDI